MTTGTQPHHHKPLVPPQRFQWAPLLMAVVTFVAGAVVGAGAYALWGPKPAAPSTNTGSRNPEEMVQRWVTRLDERVSLTEKQRPQVERFMRHYVNEYLEARLLIQADLERIQMDFNRQMLSVIGPEQKPKWEQYHQELLSRIRMRPPTRPATQPAP